ncbi:unnamed protein product [Trichogramma brassicae]|uniref:TIR domain-containing protein n=1 Tax=Trichogramma brassicae TaxID=86971 RepID=A0A6H5I3Q6_9HYME|nr:unnamed protein product [Trichogramma brassicae]
MSFAGSLSAVGLLVSLLLFWCATRPSLALECPTGSPCHCYASDINEYRIHCVPPDDDDDDNVNNKRIVVRPSLDMVIGPGAYLRLQCRAGNSTRWSDQLRQVRFEIGPVAKIIWSACPMPGPDEIKRVVQALGVRDVEQLNLENLKGELSPEDLAAFPGLRHLILSNNDLSRYEVKLDLLRGVPNLRILELRNTRIDPPSGFFLKSPQLRALELGKNELRSVKPGLFAGLRRVELLNLWSNELEHLEPSAFRGLGHTLHTLDIQQNLLVTLPSDLFAELAELEVLSMGGNRFSYLPAGLFSANQRLKVLKMPNNRANLTELPRRLLADLPGLTSVVLSRSKIHRLPADLFRASRNLSDVNLDKNFLTGLPAGLLEDQSELRSFSAVFNDLKEIPDGLFARTRKLTKLNLSMNRLTAINELSLRGLESLQELNLESNQLEHIHLDAFADLVELRVARLANNRLSLATGLSDHFGSISPLRPCAQLEQLYLANNNVSEIYADWTLYMAKLRKLDLSDNLFSSLMTTDLQFVSSQLDVDLRHNRIAFVNLDQLELLSANLDQLQQQQRRLSIKLGHNPVQCDCSLYPLLRHVSGESTPQARAYVSFDLDEARCYGPDYATGRLLSSFEASSFKCLVDVEYDKENEQEENEEDEKDEEGEDDYEACGPTGPCDCWLRPADRALLLDCSERNLTEAPPRLANHGQADCVELDLSHNSLERAPRFEQAGYERLCALDLADNDISEFEQTMPAPNLKALNLRGNNLTSIDPATLRVLGSSAQLKRLGLDDNPWSCDCQSHELLLFVQQRASDVLDLANVQCANSSNGTSLASLTVQQLCPSLGAGVPRWLAWLCSCVGVLGFVLGCSLALYYCYQREIQIWLYSMNLCMGLVSEEEIDKDKLYDAFVSYSHADEDFVLNELVAKLESGPQPYRLCIHVRDWHAGEWIVEQIERSVQESCRTIIVLTRNFVESEWGRLEFQTAHKLALSEKMRLRLVIVLMEDVGPIEALDEDLRAYLKSNTYVKWGDPWFWQKLRYALPHHRAGRTSRGGAGGGGTANNAGGGSKAEHSGEDVVDEMLTTTTTTTTTTTKSNGGTNFISRAIDKQLDAVRILMMDEVRKDNNL